MKHAAFVMAMLALMACNTKKPVETPKDQLVQRLSGFAQEGKIAYGHQDDLSYGHAWKVEDWEADALERSDIKDVTGSYPMVLGMDLGGIELGNEANLDGVPFGLIRKAAQKHAERGGIVTFSWHPRNPLTGGDAWDISSNQVVKSILPGGEKHEEFKLWLQRAADFIESVGPEMPIIFRPWHEHTGSWFWWGKELCTIEEYNELFRFTWRYFVQDRGLTNLLWCISPNAPITPEGYLERYPGDEFVDIMGADFYEFTGEDLQKNGAQFAEVIKDLLNTLTILGTEHQKLIALSETGLEGIPDTQWWTGVLYPAIKDYPICYVLTWRNAHDRPGHYYGAWKGSPDEADMKAFSEKDNIAFLD